MKNYPFNYCALFYLNQWLAYDMGYCNDLENGNKAQKLEALKKAGAFYKVARNLPTKYDEKKKLARCEPVLDIIDPLNSNDFEIKTVKKILEIENKISKRYGGKRVLSLSTKFLWLKIKRPILIYDDQARKALDAEQWNLYDYYTRWHCEFQKYLGDIQSACTELSEVSRYSVNPDIATREYIQSIASEIWFQERVFDTCLWVKGSQL